MCGRFQLCIMLPTMFRSAVQHGLPCLCNPRECACGQQECSGACQSGLLVQSVCFPVSAFLLCSDMAADYAHCIADYLKQRVQMFIACCVLLISSVCGCLNPN